MTSKAITENREWNTKIVSTEQGEVAQEILNEFKIYGCHQIVNIMKRIH